MITRRSTVFDYIELFGKVPAWITLPGAIASYFGLQFAQKVEMHMRFANNDVANALNGAVIRGFTVAGTYVVPFILTMSAFVWGYRQYQLSQMKKLAENVQTGADLSLLDWENFENLVAAGFAANGFQVQRTASGADGGIDLNMARDGHRFAVQCKHYQARSVGVEKLRAFYGAMTHAGVEAGYFVTSGEFTADARAFATGKSLFLYNGQALLDLLARGRDAATPDGRLILDRAEKASSRTPPCPLCRNPMQLKVAKQGPRSGKRFFGCSTFPDCRGTINID